MSDRPPIFLKLGGSLITDKRRPETPRLDVLARLAREIAAARRADPNLRLVLGHGSGSFGHVSARHYGTREGVRSGEQWHGFAVTADAASRLARIVCATMLEAGVPAWVIQPSVALRCRDGRVEDGPADTIAMALERGLVPLLHGDVALDAVRGGTIASTEEIFEWLARHLPPRRIVLAGEVEGVFSGDPQLDPRARRIPAITPANRPLLAADLGGSHGTDVTGGMLAKVDQALEMARRQPGLTVVVCGGLVPDTVARALGEGDLPGTLIQAPPRL